MLNTFRETIQSFRDKTYSHKILPKPIKSTLWYWSKYIIIISVLPLIISILLLTRFLPEMPKIIRENMPVGEIGAKNHLLFTTYKQPLVMGNSDFKVILNLEGSPQDAASISAGFLILKDQLIAKSPDGTLETQKFTKIPDFSFNKDSFSSWVSANLLKLWFGGVGLLIAFGLLGFGLTWIYHFSLYSFFALIFWLIGKYLMKKNFDFRQSFNLSLYASIIPIILSTLQIISPNQVFDLIGLGIYLYFMISWIMILP